MNQFGLSLHRIFCVFLMMLLFVPAVATTNETTTQQVTNVTLSDVHSTTTPAQGGLNTGVIIGIAFSALFGVALVTWGIFMCTYDCPRAKGVPGSVPLEVVTSS